MQEAEANFLKNRHKWALDKQIETTKGENNRKLTPLLNRRSYNEHKGSDNFINLLDGESHSNGRCNVERNSELSSAVFSHTGAEFFNNNEKCYRCLPSKELFQRSAICFKASLTDNMSADVSSESQFASQTLKPFSTQNLEWISFDDSCDCPNDDINYKLKETSPGCLPTKKSKSKKLQRKSSNNKTEEEVSAESLSNNGGDNERNNTRLPHGSDSTLRRKSSFINSVMRFAKFGRKKKRASQETQETSDDSNWSTESSDEKRDLSSYQQDEEFIFGGVRVYFDKNGEFCEVDQEDYDDHQSISTFSSDHESECDGRTRRTTTKFESLDSLNLGYSGSFVT